MRDRKLLNIELGRITAEEYRESSGTGFVVVLDNIRSAHNVIQEHCKETEGAVYYDRDHEIFAKYDSYRYSYQSEQQYCLNYKRHRNLAFLFYLLL